MTAIIDTETDSTDSSQAKLKFFGGLDIDTGEITILDYTKNIQIKDYIKKHKVLVGYNLKSYDKVVLENFGCNLKFNVILDLWEALAPKGDGEFGKYNANRLHDINPELQLKNYKLKTIVEALKLDTEGTKGEVDYNLLKEKEWTPEQRKEIETYLSQDLLITKKLFDWYVNIFKPLEEFLPKVDVEKYKHLSCKTASLSYKVLCNLTGLKEEYTDYEQSKKLKQEAPRILGGHHIHPRLEKVRGLIVCRDFVSHYPTTLLMYNLLKKDIAEALHKILKERLEAKKKGDKATALALKVPLNSIYGTLGNPSFKHLYNPQSANDCTRIGRELLKRYAKTLDVAGFIPLYGFTDSVYVGIPKGLSEQDLDLVTRYYIEQVKKEAPNQIDSFGLGIDGKYKFIWFIEKKDNNYLCVTQDNKIKMKGGALFDINTPQSVMKIFDDYISPKIIKELDVNFTEEELTDKLKEILINNPELSAEEYSVKDKTSYKTTTSLYYQISDRYGSGKHLLIPNIANVGVGRSEDKKYCTYEEFKEHNLTIDSLCMDKMIKYLSPFYSTKEKVVEL